MPLVLTRNAVLDEYARSGERGWVLPAFNAENQTCLEAVLAGALQFAQRTGTPDLPIIVGITNLYSQRSQTREYTRTRDWRIGLRMFADDVEALSSPPSPFADLHVMVHLDHVQWDADRELIEGDLSRFSSIMFDASALPFEENIARTAAFVKRAGGHIVVEGACDEIAEAGGGAGTDLTTPAMAARYMNETGVDIIVANLGTEHRAGAADRRYHADLARAIRDRVGRRICLHGGSSVTPAELAGLFDDGVCKVNVWTALERDSTPALMEAMLRNAGRVAGEHAARWRDEGLLGPGADINGPAQVGCFTTAFRRQMVYERMRDIVSKLLGMWYV